MNFDNFEDFTLQEARKGILMQYADIVFGKYFIYFISAQKNLYPCILYNTLLSPKAHKNRLKPYIHFSYCKDLSKILYLDTTKAQIVEKNAFSYEVGVGKRNISNIFYDVPLPLCPFCLARFPFALNDDFSKSLSQKNLTSLELKEEQNTINKNMDLKGDFASIDVKMNENGFYLSYSKEFFWLS